MAHEIEENKAFFVTRPAWHDLGVVLDNAPTVEQAISIAYPHTLFKMDLQAILTTDDGTTHTQALKNSKVIIRDDGKEFNTVGSDFELIQPQEIGHTFDPLIESGLVELEAGGSLRGGSQMWLLGKIKHADMDIVPGDQVKSYFLMYTGFDGSLRVGMSQTNVRVVCANTLAASISETKGNDFKFKHTKNVRLRMDNVVNTVKASLESFKKTTEAYKYLATKTVSVLEQEKYIESVLLTDSERDLLNRGELNGKKKAIVENVIELLDKQKGLELVPAIRGTAWQAYNAVSEYITHEHGRTVDSRLTSQWFGQSTGTNQRALDLALAM